jgi:dTDP-4-dehydrorhamnose 3,5-epimerase
MRFIETSLQGAFVIDPERLTDERGSFARSWCKKEFSERGLNTRVAQCNISFNLRRGTLRGMHYQIAPHEEVKIVRCTRGSIHDVIIDIRPWSATYGRHFAIRLDQSKGTMLYVPEGFAHGFLTLEDETEIFYMMSEFYEPAAARGFRWNDPALGISWPEEVVTISDRDRSNPDFHAERITR